MPSNLTISNKRDSKENSCVSLGVVVYGICLKPFDFSQGIPGPVTLLITLTIQPEMNNFRTLSKLILGKHYLHPSLLNFLQNLLLLNRLDFLGSNLPLFLPMVIKRLNF